MKKLLGLVGWIAAIVLAGCGAPAPDFEGQDWCYILDFKQNPQGFAIAAGTWVEGVGITTDRWNEELSFEELLSISYGYDRFVTPNYVTVHVVKIDTGFDITAAANGDVFGVSASIPPTTIPFAIDEQTLTFTPDTVGTAGTDVNISVRTEAKKIAIEYIELRGMGNSPFPQNSCSDATPTLQPDTPNPTITSTATGTPPTSTATATEFACDDDWWSGTVISHVGNTWIIEDPLTIGWGEESDWLDEYPTWSSYTVLTGFLQGGVAQDENGDGFSFGALPQETRYFFMTNGGGDPLRVQFEFDYVPECTPPTATPTSTPPPTWTPGPTATFEPLWQCVDFTASAYVFQGLQAEYFDFLGWRSQAATWSVGRNNLGTGYKKKIKVRFGQGEEFFGDIRLTDGVSQQTNFKSVIPARTIIMDFSDQAWVPRQNFFVQFSSEEIGPYTLEQLCWVDEFPYTPTPGTPPAGTLTPWASGTPRPAPSRTPLGVPIPIIYITATSGIVITTTHIYGGTGVYYATGTPYGTPAGTPSGGDGFGFGSGGGGFGDIGDMLGFGWDIGWGLLGALFAYLGQATNIVTGLLTAFNSATPQAIPGLPMCITNPMAHDLCALYYIMDNTVLAPATPGAYIAPLMQILFNVSIALYFVRWVLRIIRRGEGVTRVN